MKIFILLSVFFFWVSDTPAQKQELEQLYLKGLQFYDVGDMDSAMICFKQSEALIEKYGLQDQSISSGVYIMMGSLHVDLKKPDVAHGYYQKALTNARKYDHLEERIMAFEGLNNLHWLITKEDWPFSYPKAGETVAEQVFFPIEKTEPYKNDSILVYVLGGTNDGIRDSTLRADFYRSRANRSANEVTLASLGKGVLKQLTPNRTILALRVFDSTEIPKPNDLAMVFAYTPVQMIKNKYNAYLRNNINIINNSRQVILSRRFMVHFEDSLVRTEVMRSFKYSLIEIVNMLNEDSSLFAVLREPLADGVFKGKTALRIMDVSSTAEINLFLDFVRNFPGNYMGGNYKFSEMYATWLINQAPLSDESILNEVVMDYLEKRNSGICQKLHGQIVSRNLLQKWLDSGMEALAKDQVTENYGYIYGLMYYGNQMKNDTALAWGEFLLALGDYYSNNIEGAESNLKKAEDRFQKTGLEEGLELCNATRKKFGSDKGVVLNVQTGHFGSYRVAMSPNAKFFATGGDDFLIKIWNAELGKEFKTLKGHRDEVNSLCYSQNGRYLFSASKDSTIIVWNTFSYEPVRILKPGFSVKHISINNDATMIAAACYDSTIKVLNAKSGEIIRELREHKAGVNAVAFMSSSDNFLFSCGNDSMVYKWNINDGQYTRWFKEKGKVLNMWISNNGRFMVSLSTDAQINVWDVSSYKFQFKTKIGMYQMATGSAFYSDPVLSPDSRYLLYISPDYKLNIADLETSQFISYSSYRPGFPEQMHFTSDGKGLFIHYPFDNAIVKADLSGFASIYNNPKRPPSSQIFNYYNPTMTLDFSDDGKELYVLSSQVSGLNLETGQTNKYGFSPQPVWNPKFIWGNKKYAAEVNEKKGVFLADRQSGDTIAHYQPKNIERIQAVAWSPSGDKVFLAGDGNKLGIFCFGESREVLNTVVSVREDQILRMHFDSADHKLYLFTKDRDNGIMYVLDAQTGNILKRIDNLNALKVMHTSSWLYLLDQKGHLFQLNKRDYAIQKKLFSAMGSGLYPGEFFAVSNNDQYAVVQSDGNHIAFVDVQKEELIKEVYDHDYFGTDIVISDDNRLVATAGFDSRIHLYNPATGQRLLNVYAPLGEDFILADTAGHYLSSKKALNGLVFTYNDKPYDFEQFDLYLNRPDIVMKQLPYADKTMITSYEAAYKKRLKRSGMTEQNQIDFKVLPTITVRNKSAELLNTSSAQTMLDIECAGGGEHVEFLQVLVNNNPVFPGRGKLLSPAKSVRDTVNIPLAYGRNTVKIFCTNSKGISSMKETIEVNCSFRERKPITYFVGIAVSEYKDSSMNLQYSVKDVRDLVNTFRKISDSLVVDTLINSKATTANILKVKQKLKRLQPGDRVIVAVTGHGLLDDQFDFYYATYDIDFQNPRDRGLKYEEIEGLADGIAAQKKMILIDACHSGAVDKEELSGESGIVVAAGDSAGIVKGTRGIGLKSKQEKAPLRNTFELMQSQFTDVANNNGSIIISAAGGMEYAFESEAWNNGVFTYCVRRALENKLADYSIHGNMDNNVTIMELMNYVNEQVQSLTKGKQRPVSRRENLAFDWTINEK